MNFCPDCIESIERYLFDGEEIVLIYDGRQCPD
jgi:hypothetical protein